MVKQIVTQLRSKILGLNKESARFGALSKARGEEAAALNKILWQLEGLPGQSKGLSGDTGSATGSVDPRRQRTRDKLESILRKHGGKATYASMADEITVGAVKKAVEAFPEMFQIMQEGRPHVISLVKSEKTGVS